MSTPRNDDSEDRRRHRRRNSRVSISFGTHAEFLEASTENISAGGIFVVTDQVYPPGTEIDVDVSFDGLDEPISVRGVVRWTRESDSEGHPAGVGIEFLPDTDSEVAVPPYLSNIAHRGNGSR